MKSADDDIRSTFPGFWKKSSPSHHKDEFSNFHSFVFGLSSEGGLFVAVALLSPVLLHSSSSDVDILPVRAKGRIVARQFQNVRRCSPSFASGGREKVLSLERVLFTSRRSRSVSPRPMRFIRN